MKAVQKSMWSMEEQRKTNKSKNLKAATNNFTVEVGLSGAQKKQIITTYKTSDFGCVENPRNTKSTLYWPKALKRSKTILQRCQSAQTFFPSSPLICLTEFGFWSEIVHFDICKFQWKNSNLELSALFLEQRRKGRFSRRKVNTNEL